MNIKIGIIGLGYVGLPLARLFATKYQVLGFDINSRRIDELKNGFDSTLEITKNQLKSVLINDSNNSKGLIFSSNISDIKDCNYYIITVPTPVDKKNNPILEPLIKASKTVGSVLKKNDIVIYESTVYPGATEEDCVPVLENISGLEYNKEFYVGYSPERINPGDKLHTVEKILKVTSGSTPNTAKKINNLYKSVIKAGTFLASSIKVAEAAKVIENSQRDINIAFINELCKIFNLMNINTNDVLKAASTKWNFLPFKPGLVGGHCIGVDPYYLSFKAQEYGYNPEVILSGRKVNDSMGKYIASDIVDLMKKNNIKITQSEIIILGVTFKENCPDIRNTKVIDLINSLEEFKSNITVYDPWASKNELKNEFNLNLSTVIPNKKFDCIVLAVAHDEFKKINYSDLKKEKSVIYDVKNLLNKSIVDKYL